MSLEKSLGKIWVEEALMAEALGEDRLRCHTQSVLWAEEGVSLSCQEKLGDPGRPGGAEGIQRPGHEHPLGNPKVPGTWERVDGAPSGVLTC